MTSHRKIIHFWTCCLCDCESF